MFKNSFKLNIFKETAAINILPHIIKFSSELWENRDLDLRQKKNCDFQLIYNSSYLYIKHASSIRCVLNLIF